MLRNYLKLAWRNMGKHKADTTINLVGLCVAFTCALLLFLSVYYEFSYDRFHKNAADIYHLYFKVNKPDRVDIVNAMPAPLMPSLKRIYPEIKYGTRYINGDGVVSYNDKKLSKDVKFTDPDFFKMFSFHFLKGNASTALNDLNSVVLKESSAKAIFGNEDPMGKTIQLQTADIRKPFLITGVVEDYPGNSSITYDLVVRFENNDSYARNSDKWDSWNHDVYVQLQPNITPENFIKRTPPFIAQNFKKQIEDFKKGGIQSNKNKHIISLGLQPLLDVHTDTSVLAEGSAISKKYLYLLLTIGFLIILIACINFINLSIGRSFTRSHEIGLRKTLGAQKFQLIGQFWSEAFVVCLLALIVSSVLCYIVLPSYKLLFGMSINKAVLLSPSIWISVFFVFVLITAIAGGYPAWLMSRFNVVQILKGKISVARSGKLRNGLIVVQFSIAILLMICTLISWQQINYLREQPLGYNRHQVISIPVEGEVAPAVVLQRIKDKASAYPPIESISGIYDNLGRALDGSSRRSQMGFNYKTKSIQTAWMGVSYDFTKTLDIKLLDGRDFSKDFPTDSNGVIINEAMAAQIGEKNIIGTLLPIEDNQPPMPVIGVVKNFNFEPLKNKIQPLTLVMQKRFAINYVLVKVKPGNLKTSMDLLKNIWKEVNPGNDFKGSFLDENVQRQYTGEEKLGKIFMYGAVIAIVLSCMGLLAMVLLIVAQRLKEIGIRKVLGASVTSIVGLVTKDFLMLTLIAFVIAAPLSWYFMNMWLQDFAYRINIEWWVFAIACITAIAVAFITISFQAIRAALSNPVKSLRSE
jgi:putative ABC transport system permease protein